MHAGVNKKSLCSVAACFAKDVGGGKCKSHGGRATCTKEGCDRKVAARGVCRVHDESAPRCEEDGCDELARARGRCRNHGGYVNRDCGRDGCAKHALSGSEHCRAHGGGKRCQREGCGKGDAGGGFCVSHGGGKRCKVPNCPKGAAGGTGQF